MRVQVFRAPSTGRNTRRLLPGSTRNGATEGANRCQYCVVAHGAMLGIRAKDPVIADQLAINGRKANLSDRHWALSPTRSRQTQPLRQPAPAPRDTSPLTPPVRPFPPPTRRAGAPIISTPSSAARRARSSA